ncbi:HNH endonuclease [Litoribrevibacter albus]|uniref:Putative HNH nuclease YajD n=1 Tax=Litoribrevibacter albus TaxID=1473156 RepID=A0AA37SBV9_9GAMM|nr:HNH endonuclease [Litoribrevibacter albus]GLQ31653.1 restriction endonuclease [Litoribrevibacter albus]
MPNAAKKPCSKFGCKEVVERGQRFCSDHKALHQETIDKQRGTAAQRGYGSRWQKARLGFLRNNPLCLHCHAEGLTISATVVDHIIPHKGDMALFWDRANWQPLCKRHHDIKTATEDGGFGRGRGV